MSFQLSQSVDTNKVFLVNRSELQGRLDPAYNLALIKNKILSSYPKQKIGKLSHSYSGGTPSKVNHKFWDGKIPWVSPKDMKSFYLDDSIDHITKEAIRESSTNLIPRNSTLIVVRSGILQHTIPVSVTTKEMAINQDIKALVFNETVVPEYPAYYIDIYQTKLLPLIVKHSTTVQSINTDQFDRLEIPIPPKKIQEKIVSKMDEAYLLKKQKNAQARQLLNSIDNYLLDELGIVLPKQEENTVESRIFTRQLSEMSGRRLDPLYHSESIYRFINRGSFPAKILSSLVVYMKTGFAAGKQDQSTNEEDVIQIRPTNINSDREFIFNRNIFIHREPMLRSDDLLIAGEVLFNNTNSQELVGKSIYFDLDGQFYCSNHMTRLMPVAKQLNAEYLVSILNLYQRNKVFYKLCTNWNNQSGVNVSVLSKVAIPLPPLEKQKEIAIHISLIRQQAKQLQKEAIEDLEQAKQEVEAMILGEA